MSVLVGPQTKLLVQGLGRDGSFQASRMREYGTNMVAAVHPNREGQKFEDAVPYFSSVVEAVRVYVDGDFSVGQINAELRNIIH